MVPIHFINFIYDIVYKMNSFYSICKYSLEWNIEQFIKSFNIDGYKIVEVKDETIIIFKNVKLNFKHFKEMFEKSVLHIYYGFNIKDEQKILDNLIDNEKCLKIDIKIVCNIITD